MHPCMPSPSHGCVVHARSSMYSSRFATGPVGMAADEGAWRVCGETRSTTSARWIEGWNTWTHRQTYVRTDSKAPTERCI
eukprot:38978-Eustigmatos_ZCMA.PRE.1